MATILKESSFVYLISPVIIVGRLIARERLPAVFISMPKSKINTGIIYSPPAAIPRIIIIYLFVFIIKLEYSILWLSWAIPLDIK